MSIHPHLFRPDNATPRLADSFDQRGGLCIIGPLPAGWFRATGLAGGVAPYQLNSF